MSLKPSLQLLRPLAQTNPLSNLNLCSKSAFASISKLNPKPTIHTVAKSFSTMPGANLDPAVAKLLNLPDPGAARVSSAGGGGMSSASTSKITAGDKVFFMKTGRGDDAKVMFEGEHASLNAIHGAVPTLCPRSHGTGAFTSAPGTYFLVTTYLTLSPRFSATTSSATPNTHKPQTLAQKLATLHTTPAPAPPGHSTPQFGFPVPTCCGDTPQDNTFTASWAEFYADRRLRFIMARSEASNGPDKELSGLVERTAGEVVPALIGDKHLNNGKGVMPVVVHGDLWSGNAGKGVLEGEGGGQVEDVVFDSSACYAHSEFELGIMKMFGGFGGSFLEEYHRLCPKTEPVAEYGDRVALYELYHHLNHHALFGGGYRSGAVSIMERLIRKYGRKGGD